ncbi:MAG: hypothetical protein V5786_11695 [Psychromonas sp.]
MNFFPHFKDETIDDVFEFAYAMSFAKKGAHRDHRSGGTHHRKNSEIFINAFQGKLSELAVYNYFFQFNRALYQQLSPPNFDVYGLLEWDDCDLQLKEKYFSIKSTKYYGNLLLLECKDWNKLGQYKPNLKTGKPAFFDFFVLVRIKSDGDNLLKSNKYLYVNTINKQELLQLIKSQRWYFDIPGYLTHKDLVEVITCQQLLPQGAILNKKTKVDADNYYIQSGDLSSLEQLILEMKNEL